MHYIVYSLLKTYSAASAWSLRVDILEYVRFYVHAKM